MEGLPGVSFCWGCYGLPAEMEQGGFREGGATLADRRASTGREGRKGNCPSRRLSHGGGVGVGCGGSDACEGPVHMIGLAEKWSYSGGCARAIFYHHL